MHWFSNNVKIFDIVKTFSINNGRNYGELTIADEIFFSSENKYSEIWRFENKEFVASSLAITKRITGMPENIIYIYWG